MRGREREMQKERDGKRLGGGDGMGLWCSSCNIHSFPGDWNLITGDLIPIVFSPLFSDLQKNTMHLTYHHTYTQLRNDWKTLPFKE